MTRSLTHSVGRDSTGRTRRALITTVSIVGGLIMLGLVGEFVLRGIMDRRIESASTDLPAGVSITRDGSPVLWQLATGQAEVHVEVSPETLTQTARDVTDLSELQLSTGSGHLIAQVPLSIAGSEQNIGIALSVTVKNGHAVFSADTIEVAGIAAPVAIVAKQLGNEQLIKLSEGVTFPEGDSPVTITAVQVTDEGLELDATMAIWE